MRTVGEPWDHAVPTRNQGRVGAGAVPGRRLDVVGRRADFRAAGRWPRAGRAARTDSPSSASENAGGAQGPGPSAAAWAPMAGFGPNAMPGRAPPPKPDGPLLVKGSPAMAAGGGSGPANP